MSGERRTRPILAIVLLSYLMIVVDISIAVSLTVAAGTLALALVATVALIVRPGRSHAAARAASGPALPQVPTPEPATSASPD